MAAPNDSPFYGDEFAFEAAMVDVDELADGRLISVGIVRSPEGFFRVVAQLYDTEGTALGTDFVVEQDGGPNPVPGDGFMIDNPAVVGLADGGFAISWREEYNFSMEGGGSATENTIKFRIFNEDGTVRSSELSLSETKDSHRPWITELTPYGDGFLATWSDVSDDGADAWSTGILARAFDKFGNPVSRGALDDDPHFINDTRSGMQSDPHTALLTDGSLVIVYQDGTGDGSGDYDIRAKILGKNGSVLVPEFVAHEQTTGSQWNPDVTALADGRFAAMCESVSPLGGFGLFVQMFELDRSGAGVKAVFDGSFIQVAQTSSEVLDIRGAEIVGTAGSGFFVTWIEKHPSEDPDISNDLLLGQFFNADGTRRGDEIEIAAGYLDSGKLTLAESNKGGILVTWQENVSIGDDWWVQKEHGRFLSAPVEAGDIDPIEGTKKADRLRGTDGDDVIYGKGGNDTLRGLAGADELIGGKGVDKLYGGPGADTFVFETGDSGKEKAKADTIYDFTKDDTIDLSGWDANAKKAGDQNFKFIGTDGFHGKAGELRYRMTASETWIEGDTNGDGKADFLIHLDDPVKMKADYFDL